MLSAFQNTLNTQQQIALLQDVAAFVRAGMPPYEALESMAQIAKKRKRKKMFGILNGVLKRMSAGKSLSVALQGQMDGAALNMVAAGEDSGDLVRSCLEAADFMIKRKEMSSILIKSLIAPAIQFVLLVGLIYYVSLQVVPAAGNLLPVEQMSALSQAYFGFGSWFIRWGLISVLVFFVFTAIIVLTLPVWVGPMRGSLDQVFPWSLYRYVQSGGALLTLSAMMRAGIPFPQAVQSMSAHSSPWAKRCLRVCMSNLSKGKNEAESLSRSGLLPPSIDDRLSVYAKLPDFASIMVPLAHEAMQESKSRLSGFAALVSTGSMFLIAAFILFTVFGLGDAAMSAADAAQAGSDI